MPKFEYYIDNESEQGQPRRVRIELKLSNNGNVVLYQGGMRIGILSKNDGLLYLNDNCRAHEHLTFSTPLSRGEI